MGVRQEGELPPKGTFAVSAFFVLFLSLCGGEEGQEILS